MSLLVAWVVFPLVLTALCVGCGIVLERAAGVTLPRALVAPAGLATLIVVAQGVTASDATAKLSVPVAVAVAVAGLALALPWRVPRGALWAAGSAVGAFAAYAAPVALSGKATFAGYIKLDDTATWFAMTDRVLDHGSSLAGLAPSSYEATLDAYVGLGYPFGAMLPLGIGHVLVGQDVAWVFQPYVAFLGAMLALVLYALLGSVVVSRPLRAAGAFVAAQPALLYGYSLWGGVKEVAGAPLIALGVALFFALLRGRVGLRSALPLAVAAAAVVSVLSLGGGAWLAPAILLVGIAVARRRRRAFVLAGAGVAFFGLALSTPPLLAADVFLRTSASWLRADTEFGNLIGRLDILQVFGIWPTGDFRGVPRALTSTHVLIGLAAVAAAVGVYFAWTRRRFDLVLYLATVGIGLALAASAGSPWVNGKAYAMASPALLLAAVAGAAAAIEAGKRVEGGLAFAALAFGVLWSNALAYHEVWLAPRDQLVELEHIGSQFAGQGPALMTEYQPYGVRHFLRKLDAEGASELRRRQVPLRDGRLLGKAEYADLDQLRLDGLLVYRTIVLRRSPFESRPPDSYRLVWSGHWYDVWQRDTTPAPSVLGDLPLGGPRDAGAQPRCEAVRALAATPGAHELAYVERRPVITVQLGSLTHPADWPADANDPGVVYPSGDGTALGRVDVARSGSYEAWLGGSFRRRFKLTIDGKRLAAVTHQLNNSEQWTPFGSATLSAGVHDLQLSYRGNVLRPGDGGSLFGVGPLVLSPVTKLNVRYVAPRAAATLCGRTLDWIEAVA